MGSHLAKSGGAEHFPDALGKWTAHLWQDSSQETACFYIDGHRKPVYTTHLIPRGLIGRSGKILGCRALVLLHDEQGHPRLATTARGDEHLTIGLPQILLRYEQATEHKMQTRVIVDREGMAAAFLRDLQADGYTMVTLLKTDQYQDFSSFTEVEAFVPLEYDRQGQVVREVAPACFALPWPDQPGTSFEGRSHSRLAKACRLSNDGGRRRAGRRASMEETERVARGLEGRADARCSYHSQTDSNCHDGLDG